MNIIKKAVVFLFSISVRNSEEEFNNQNLICSRQADRSGLIIKRVFKDITNKIKIQNRPSLEEAVKYAVDAKNGISVFLVTDKEKLSRDPNEAEMIMATLERNGVKVVIAEA